jgi:hypothetical protein
MRGLAWLEKEDNCLKVTTGWPGYTLYGIERVGLASGFKYFGENDWYRKLAQKLVHLQGRMARGTTRAGCGCAGRWRGART